MPPCLLLVWCLLPAVRATGKDTKPEVEMLRHTCRPADCVDLQCFNVVFENSGPHLVYRDNSSVAMSCDVSAGGGWTVIQRRLDGSVNFTQPWEAYRNGFGQHGGTTELWFGNEHVYRMSLHQPLRMRMELTSFDFDATFIEYDNFSLASEQKKYKLKYDKATPHVSWVAHLQPFSTYDDDNSATGNCSSKTYRKGWWYHDCFNMHLNGEYPRGFETSPKRWYRYIVALPFRRNESLRACSMKVRPMAVGHDVRAFCARHRKNPCGDGGTCVYVAATDRSECRCPRRTCGPRCEWVCMPAIKLQPGQPAKGNTRVPLIVGVVSLLLVALVAGGTMCYVHQTHRHDPDARRRNKTSNTTETSGSSSTGAQHPKLSGSNEQEKGQAKDETLRPDIQEK